MDLFSEMCSVICEQVGIDVKKITKQSRLKEDLGIDSVDFVQLLMGIEEKFGVTVSEDSISQIKTVNDLISLVD